MQNNQDSNEVLGVLNANTDDSLVESIKEDVKATNKFNIQLSKDQSNARTTGYTQSSMGVVRTNDSPRSMRSLNRQVKQSNADDSYVGYNDEDITADLNVKQLYEETLGNSAYKELKHRVGLSDSDSFTEYYNRTHYIPAGFEMEARLALAEEKRMKLYAEYEAGEMSETDFLYKAYGKELLKESGVDLDSTLYWYKQHQQGIYTSPLDSDTFLIDLLDNARSLWEAETWYRDKNSKTLSSSLAGVVTGQTLSSDKVYKIFKDQFDKLDEHFDNDINQIIAYYQAGTLNRDTFDPFIDIDDDGKYDYYYHLDGKMYAVKGGSGQGRECTVEYNPDGSLHSVDITDGPDWLEGIGTGLRNFLVGFVDIGYLVYNAGASFFGGSSYGNNFVNNQQDYEAWKARNYLGGQTEIILDGSSQWTAYNIGSAVGEIAGTIAMTVLTMGAGSLATGVKVAGKEGAKVLVSSLDDLARLGLNSVDDLARIGVSSLDDIGRLGLNIADDAGKSVLTKFGAQSADDLAKQLGESAAKLTKKGIKTISLDSTAELAGKSGKEIIKFLKRSGLDDKAIQDFVKSGVLKNTDGTVYKLITKGSAKGVKDATRWAGSKLIDGSRAVFGTLSRAKTGQGFGAGMWTQAISSSSILAVQDFASTYTNLSAANKSLKYLEEVTNGEVQALTDGEIFTRAGVVAGTDLLFSTFLRLAGSDGLTTKTKSLFGSKTNDMAKKVYKGLSPVSQSHINNLSKHLVANSIIDNIADAAENIITSGVSLAANNINGDFNIASILGGMGDYLTSPSGALMTTYVTAKNFVSAPKSTGKAGQILWGESTLDQRRNSILQAYGDMSGRIDTYISRLKEEVVNLETMRTTTTDPKASQEIEIKIEGYNSIVDLYTKYKSDTTKTALAATIEFAIDFDKNIADSTTPNEEIIKLLGLTPKVLTDGTTVSPEEQAKKIKDIMTEFSKNNTDMGVFSAYVLDLAQQVSVEEALQAYQETIDNSLKLAEGQTEVFTQAIKGTLDIDSAFKEGSWQYKHVNKFLDTVNEISSRMKYNSQITMRNIQQMLFKNRTVKLKNKLSTFQNTFDATFDLSIFSTQSLLHKVEYAKKADGTLYIKSGSGNKKAVKDVKNDDNYKVNPLVQMFLNPQENKESIKQLMEAGYFYLDANNRITINESSKAPILGIITVKPDAMNRIKDKDSAEAQLHDTYQAIAELGQAMDVNGNPVADWDSPLLTQLEITDPKNKNGSGNDSKYRIFIVGNKIDANLLDFFNKPERINTMVESLHVLNSSSDVDDLKAASLNLMLSMSDRDEADLSALSAEDFEKEVEAALPKVMSALLSMSNATTSNKSNNALFTRERILYLCRLGLIPYESLKDIASNKLTAGFSHKAKQEAEFLVNYIDNHDAIAQTNKIFNKINRIVAEKGDIEFTESELKHLKKTIISLKKPENKLVLDALREDKVINEFFDKFVTETDVYFPFVEGLEGKEQPLVDSPSVKTSSKEVNEDALKNLINSFLERANIKAFTQSYNKLYEGMGKTFFKDVLEKKRNSIIDKDKIIQDITQAYSKHYISKEDLAKSIASIEGEKAAVDIDIQNIKILKTYLSSLDAKELSNFFRTPEIYFETLKKDLLANGTMQEEVIDSLVKDLMTTLNSKALMNVQFDDMQDELREDTLKTYLRIALNKSTEPLEGTVTQDANGNWIYKDANNEYDIADTLLASDITTKQIVDAFDTQPITEKVMESIGVYRDFLKTDTITKEATNTLEINLLDLIPSEYAKLLRLYKTAEDAKSNHALQMIEDNLKRELNGILNASSFNYQMKEYLQLIKVASKTNSFIISIPLNDGQAMNAWRNTFKRLGYENEFVKLSLGEPATIPGVLYKDSMTSAIETGLSLNYFRDIFANHLKVETHEQKGLAPKDNKNILINMFDSVTYLTEDTTIDLTADQVFYGIPKTGNIEVDAIGSHLLDRLVKAGLSGGEFAKVFNILSNAMYQTDVANPKAENSFKVLQMINAVSNYMEGEFKQTTHQIKMTAKEYNKVKDFYSKNPNSVFIPQAYDADRKEAIFIANPNFNKDMLLDSCTVEFDIRTLIPAWGNFTEASGKAEYRTAISVMMDLGYTIEDLKNLSVKPIEILNISTKALEDSKQYVGKDSIKNLLTKIPENSDNYYVVTKRAYLESAIVYANKLKETLSDNPDVDSILKFANRKTQVLLGNLLNSKFKDINYNNPDEVRALTEALRVDLNNSPDFKDTKNNKLDYYSENITSADIGKLTSGEAAEINEYDIEVILKMISSHTDLLVNTEDETGLPKHNSAMAILSCIDEDNNGAFISMEYYQALSRKDREIFIKVLEERLNAEPTNSPIHKALKETLAKLKDKDSKLETFNNSRAIPTADKYDIEFANAPTVEITKTIWGGLSDEHVKRVATLVANREYAKLPPKKYISSSSIDANSTFNPLVEGYMDLINETLYRTVDKQGHTMVYNLNSKEAIQEFFGSIVGFTEVMLNSKQFEGIDEAVLLELAMHANAYSTGTTIDSEYSGALILEYDDANNYKIIPVETSSSDRDKGIYSHLLFDESTGLSTTSKNKRVMITLDKNAFIKTPSGISSSIYAFDLNDETTRGQLLQRAYYKAVEYNLFKGHYSDADTPEDILFDYYKPKTLKTSEIFNHLVTTLKAQGIDDSVAKNVLPTIQKLNVANETSLNEEQMYNLVTDLITSSKVSNAEVATLKDIFLHKVTNSALPEDTKLELEDAAINFLDTLSKEDRGVVRDIVRDLLDIHIEDKTRVFERIKTLSDDSKASVYKLLVLKRKTGKDLSFLMNRIPLSEYSNYIRSKVTSSRNPVLDYYKNNRVCSFDTEWLTQEKRFEDLSKQELYQIGFAITKPISDYNSGSYEAEEYTILIADSLEHAKGQLANSSKLHATENDLFHVESDEDYQKKLEQVKAIGRNKNKGNVFVVNTIEEAIAKFKELTSDVKHFAGYNNKSEGSDNRWFGDYFETDGRQVIDVRTDVNHKTLSSKTEGLSGDSLQEYRDKGIITKRQTTTAHDANSDVLDTIDLFLKIASSEVDVRDTYDELAVDARSFCKKAGITDEEAFLKKIAFEKDIFEGSRIANEALFKSVDVTNKDYLIGNKELKEAFSAYNNLLAKRYRRVRIKDFNRTLDNFVLDGSEHRQRFVAAVKDSHQRDTVQKVLATLFTVMDVDYSDSAKVLEAYDGKKGVANFLHSAVKLYKEETYGKDTKVHKSNSELIEEFLTKDLTVLTDYLQRGNSYYNEETGEYTPYVNPDRLAIHFKADVLQNTDTTKFKEAWTNTLQKGVRSDFPDQETAMWGFNYLMKPVTSLLGFGESGFNPDNILNLSEDTANRFLYNISHVYGATKENIDTIKGFGKSRAVKLDFFSKVDKELLNEAIDVVFNEDFHKTQALYTMAQEAPEGLLIPDGGKIGNVKAETGVIYINKALLNKAYPDLQVEVGDELYTEAWRQPGQHKTVTHIMKVKVVDSGSMSMTRTTAKSYFNGDFDGDFYYFANPTKLTQAYGDAIDKYLRAHTSLIDNLFDGIALKDSTLEPVLKTIEDSTHAIIQNNKDLINKLINNPTEADLEVVKNLFFNALANANPPIKDAKKIDSIWKDFGFKIVNFAELSNENKNILITNNPYIKTSNSFKDIQEGYNKLLENSQNYLHANQYSDYYDSQVVGDIAKKLNVSKATGNATDVLYSSRVTFTSDTTLRIEQAILTDGAKAYSNITSSIDALVTKGIISKEDSALLKQVLGDSSLYTKATEDTVNELSKRILNTVSLTQDIVLNKKEYNDSITNFLKGQAVPDQESIAKLEFLVEQANKFLDAKITITEHDKASRPALLKKASEVINTLTTNKQRLYSRYLSLNSSNVNNLFKEAVLKGNVEIDTVDKLNIISNKNKVYYDKDKATIGTKTIKVAVLDSDIASDTMLVTKNNRDSIETFESIDNIKKLSAKQKEGLFNLYERQAEVSGHDLNVYLNTDEFDDNITYTFRGAINSAGNEADSYEAIDQILISTKKSIRNSPNYFKVGATTGKNLKTTLGISDIDFGKNSDIGYVIPKNMLINKDTGAYEKFGPNAKISQLGTEKDSQGRTYTIYEVSDMAIIDTSADKRLSNSVRSMDRISILQGSQGLEAAVSFGKWFLSVNGDKVEYDPEGYKMLMDAIDSKNKPMAEETNGMAELNFLRIATLINVLPDDVFQRVAEDMEMPDLSRQEVLTKIYEAADLGGQYGDRLLDKLEPLVTRDTKTLKKFKELRDSNPLLKNAFSTTLESKLENSARQTSQDLLDNEGKPFESYRSKRAMPKYNARYTAMKNNINLQDRMVSYDGSAIDYNSNYIGKFDLLQTLNPENTFSKTKLDTLYEAQVLDYVEGRRGNLSNKFKFITNDQGKEVDVTGYSNLVDKKVGAQTPESSLINQSRGTVTGLLTKPKGSRDMNTQTGSIGFVKDMEKTPTFKPNLHPRLSAMMGDGSRESIYQSFSPSHTTAGYSSSVPYLGVQDGSMQLKTAQYSNSNMELSGGHGIKQRIIQDTKTPLAAIQLEQLNKSKRDMLSKTKDALDFVDMSFKEAEFTKEIQELSRKIGELNQVDTFSYDKNYWESLHKMLLEEEESTTISLVRIYNNSNDVELVKSVLRSWGFKAAQNKDISLGNKVISVNKYADAYKHKMLAEDYDAIVSILKRNKNINYSFNYYMEISRRLEMYEELKTNRAKWVKKFGEATYKEYITKAESQLLNGFSTIDEVKTKLNTLLNESPILQTLVQSANKINHRIQETARKLNPYTILGYSIPMYEKAATASKDDKWLGATLAANNKQYSPQENRLLINDEMKKDGNVYKSIPLYDADCDGYIAMVQRIATDIAAEQSMSTLKTTLVNEGWMRNAEVTEQATKYFKDTSTKLFEELAVSKGRARDIDVETYNLLRNVLNEAGIVTPMFTNYSSFKLMYNTVEQAVDEMYKNLKLRYNISNLAELYQALDANRDSVNYNDLYANVKLANAYQQVTATICSMISETSSGKNFLKDLYNSVYNSVKSSSEYTLVDDRGADLHKKFATYKTVDLDGYARYLKYGDNLSVEEKQIAIAQMMLSGEVFLMKKSVANQLYDKVFTKKVPGKIARLFRKTTQLATSFVMSTPLQLVDRILNYTIYDVGVIGSADAEALKYLPTSIATIRRYMSSIDSIDEYSLKTDKNLQYLIRYIAASGQSPLDSNVFRGETIDPSNIPVIKAYLKKVNEAFNQQNLAARFAYFLDLVKSAEANGAEILSTKAGVAFHMMDEIAKIKGDAKTSEAYNEYNQRYADIDAQAAQIIAENLGAVGNNPYGATTLGRMGFMFTTFPLIGARWATNRLQSLAYAFTHLNDSSSVRYLGRNLGSLVLTQALLLALEVMLSGDAQEYIFGDKEDMNEEKIKNAENIIFRGGCIKLFESILSGDEVTTAAHNRGTEYALYDSFLKDLLELEEDETVGTGLTNIFKSQVWSHLPALVKDPIESIPGNNFLQSTSWATPSDNFFDNYARKVSGYLMGSAHANAFIDSIQASEYEKDMNLWDRISLGFQKAYTEKSTNIKEYKSEYKNYKKAFSLVYEYNELMSRDEWAAYDTYAQDSYYKTFKSELSNAIKNGSTPEAIYSLISTYKAKGMSLSAMLSAFRSSSLKYKLSNMDNLEAFMDSLSDSERSIIKAALIYEDYNYPYLEDVIEELTKEYNYYNKSQYQKYLPNISTIVSNFNRNAGYYNFSNQNYRRYSNLGNYVNYLKTSNQYKPRYNNPSDVYEDMMNTWKYGKSTDIYGNKYTNYTNSSGDKWKWGGNE